MDGVTILNQTMVYEWPTWAFIVIIVMAIIFGIGISVIIEKDSIFGGLVTLISFLVAIVLALIDPKVETGLYKYEAIIDDDVSFTELYEQYDLIARRGEIYILQDKEDQE